MTMPVLGLDTSNYTTSAAVFDGADGCNAGRLLAVRPGELGLRQSDALFQHVKQLPALLEELEGRGLLRDLKAVGASTRPRAVEGSYMPCFLAGESQGRALAAALGVPFFACSHQQGHLAAAAWSAGRTDLLDGPFLAWHLSGGTTELLLVRPQGTNVAAEKLGGTSDISAGQLIDRTGVLLGLQFPAGKALDELYPQADACMEYRVKLKDLTFSLSGMENQVKRPRPTWPASPWTRCAAWSSGPPRRPSAAAPACRCCAPAVWPPTDSCGPPWRGAAAPCSPSPATPRTTPWGWPS